MNRRSIAILIGLVLAIAVVATSAYAWRGMGKQAGGCPYQSDLSAEDVKAVETARDAFRAHTRDQRLVIHQKQLALMAELAKSDPDAKAAQELQKQISDLEADLARPQASSIGWRKGQTHGRTLPLLGRPLLA